MAQNSWMFVEGLYLFLVVVKALLTKTIEFKHCLLIGWGEFICVELGFSLKKYHMGMGWHLESRLWRPRKRKLVLKQETLYYVELEQLLQYCFFSKFLNISTQFSVQYMNKCIIIAKLQCLFLIVRYSSACDCVLADSEQCLWAGCGWKITGCPQEVSTSRSAIVREIPTKLAKTHCADMQYPKTHYSLKFVFTFLFMSDFQYDHI